MAESGLGVPSLHCQVAEGPSPPQNSVDAAKPLLRKAIQISQQTPYWHCRLLFQLAVSPGVPDVGPAGCGGPISQGAGVTLSVRLTPQQLHTLEKDLVSACDLLGVGAEYARVVGSEYTR